MPSMNLIASVLLTTLLFANFLEIANSMQNGVKSQSPQHSSRTRGHLAKHVHAEGEEKPFNAKDYILDIIAKDDHEKIEKLENYAVAYSHTIGNVMVWEDEPIDRAIVPPLSLLPSPFPENLFKQVQALQKTMNELYLRVTLNHKFLERAYEDLMDVDEWITRQVNLMKMVKEKGINQKKTLILQRNDYLTHFVDKVKGIEIKQVEVNIGQVGGPGIANTMANVHAKMLEKVENMHHGMPYPLNRAIVPPNNAIHGVAEGMFEAWQSFGDPEAIIVFLFDKSVIDKNYFEQLLFMQFEVEKLAHLNNQLVNVELVTIPETVTRIHLEESDFSLYLSDKSGKQRQRVALVHMVCGLLPKHWSKQAWAKRLEMERSTAILSPNIRAQLAGTKRVQQMLAKPGVLEEFFPDEPEKVAELRKIQVKLWGLEENDPETKAAIEDAIRNPKNYVLKAQLGSGKGNFFDDDLKNKMEAMKNKDDRKAFTLMQKIRPIAVKNYMRRQLKKPMLQEVNVELGIFGIILGEGDPDDENNRKGTVLFNKYKVGQEGRTKLASANQGGITEGYGFMDSIVLFDEKYFKMD